MNKTLTHAVSVAVPMIIHCIRSPDWSFWNLYDGNKCMRNLILIRVWGLRRFSNVNFRSNPNYLRGSSVSFLYQDNALFLCSVIIRAFIRSSNSPDLSAVCRQRISRSYRRRISSKKSLTRSIRNVECGRWCVVTFKCYSHSPAFSILI